MQTKKEKMLAAAAKLSLRPIQEGLQLKRFPLPNTKGWLMHGC
jgi:hypothetical protein